MSKIEKGTLRLKTGLAEMLKGGVIMDVTNDEQAKIAEDAGACAVMALERVPSDIRRDGGVARMSDPAMIEKIVAAVSIPVMAKCRIGHFVEAQVLEALGVDYVDESEVLTPADEEFHVDKFAFSVPFVCGCRNLGEALRRIGEGAAMIRTKGEAGTGNVVEAVRHLRAVRGEIRKIQALGPEAVVVTGGHSDDGADVLFDGIGTLRIDGPRYADGTSHGSGCTHSSALAAFLARNAEVAEAARWAREIASEAVGNGLAGIGSGAGPVDATGIIRR